MTTIRKYPKQIPIYITRSNLASNSTHLSRHKFLVAPDITIQTLVNYIKNTLKLSVKSPLFLYCNNIIQTPNTLIADIYSTYKTNDAELYMIYSTEHILDNPTLNSLYVS